MVSKIPLSASARPLALRKRPDLIVFPQRFSGRTYLGIKDPLTMRYYQLREEEFFILQQLDGRVSAEYILDTVHREFAPRRISLGQLQAFLSMLHREGLITSDAQGQGRELLARGREARQREALSRFGNLLAVRFRGWDPERLLSWLYPKLRCVFSTPVLIGIILLVASAASLVALRFSEISARMPEIQAFFQGESLIWFAVAIAGTKILHEFAHGLTCKHYGGECHELGVMLLAFTPCLYVNVSDAWLLPNKWQRIAISGAGIVVELCLAAGCTFVWWFSEPGLLNSLCLHVMLVCSLSTLVFNGNPLLRYDGYYVLTDALEVPNLAQRAAALFWRGAARIALGIDIGGQRLWPPRHRTLLVAYAVASFLYRLLVVATILWFFHLALRPLGLQSLVQILTVTIVAGMFGPPLWRAFRFFQNPIWASQVKRTRLLLTTAALTFCGTALLTTPLPHRVTVPALLQLQGAQRVFVSVPGRLQWAASAGTSVRQGEAVGRLVNSELELEITRLRGERAVLQSELDSLKQRSAQQASRGVHDVDARIPAAEKALEDVHQRLREREDEQGRLTLTASIGGTVMPPPRRPLDSASDRLDAWSGSPLERINRDAYLAVGTPFCVIGEGRLLESVLIIDQARVRRVEVGQVVHVQLDQLPEYYVQGRVAEIARIDVQSVPPALAASGKLPLRNRSDGQRELAGVFYRARVQLEDCPPELLPGGIGRARIHVAPRSLGRRLLWYLSDTFRFQY
jgi:putative peptide zinc metalloprotease protein